jgi:hypothetical protein
MQGAGFQVKGCHTRTVRAAGSGVNSRTELVKSTLVRGGYEFVFLVAFHERTVYSNSMEK